MNCSAICWLLNVPWGSNHRVHPVHRAHEVEYRELGVDRPYRTVCNAHRDVSSKLMVEPVAACRDDLSVGWSKRIDLRQDRKGAEFAGEQFKIASREGNDPLEPCAFDGLRESYRLVSEIARDQVTFKKDLFLSLNIII